MTQTQATSLSEFADIRFTTGISIIIPTYKEVENIPHILERIDQLRRTHDLTA
ncbi:hypothetical protein ACERZ8_00060 [Tateyamaria armeniaca]|uniref:Uncharacterized protein n=1 Tax=Tateyamaria armeniaca TaxID=2518930 RepID=A0ABW8UMI7_9RHOB